MRGVSAFFLVVIAAVHLNLYAREDYDKIPTIDWLFLLTVVTSLALAVGLFVRPGWLTEISSALFVLSVLGGYLLTLYLPHGMFGFKEPGISFSGGISIGAEIAVAVLSLRLIARRRARSVGRSLAPTQRGVAVPEG